MRSRTGSSNGPGGTTSSSSSGSTVGINVNSSMERNGGGSGGNGGGGGRSRLHHKRRPGHRRNTQHSVATVEPICDMRKVVNGVVAVDQDKLTKLVQTDPIDMHYAVEEEPFASGLFATVRKCRHRITGVEYAAKYAAKIRYGQDCTTEILHEIALMSLCTTNPRIIHLIDVFDTPTHMILVMEYAPGGDLQTLMDDDMVPYERDAVKFVRQVLEGLLFLHERSMAHLDIKLQNVLLMGTFPDCDVKLCDLEISRIIVAGQEVRELLGTPDYVSPEILHYEPITLAADIWSVGVMAYVLLTGFTPFGGDTDQETFHNICHGQLDFPDELFEDISPQAEDFIRKTLTREPSCRPTVKECLKHPWLTTWKNVVSHQRETISSESQRRSTALNNGPLGGITLTCPRSAAAAAASINGHSPSPSTASRSLQRAMSKSREVLYERVAASNLRKSTSKSRERLCEMKLSVSRSRDHLCDLLQPSAAQSRERLHSLRNFSKSHEVLSLLNEKGTVLSAPAPSKPFAQLPATQSLECFSISYSDKEEAIKAEPETNLELAVSARLSSLEFGKNGDVIKEPQELSRVMSESTETLCNESEGSNRDVADGTDVADETTPSNSRPTTPTHELKISSAANVLAASALKDSVCEEKFHAFDEKSQFLLTRADAVASSLKRLSASGPPTPKILNVYESLSPSLPKPAWNWSSASLPTPDENSMSADRSPMNSSNTGYSMRRQQASPTSFSLDNSVCTSPTYSDETKSMAHPAEVVVFCTSPSLSSPSSIVSPVDERKCSVTPDSKKVTSIDTSSLSDSQRQLLSSCLNRRRASWACGTRQEYSSPISGITPVSLASKQTETKLSVSELISNFNQCQAPGGTASGVQVGLSKPSSVKKLSIGPVFQQEATLASPSTSTSRVISDREKSVFKPLSASIQVFQKTIPTPPAITSANLTVAHGVHRGVEPSTSRSRTHHTSWDVRALPRLPEDTVCNPQQDDSVSFIAPELKCEKNLPENINEKTISTPEVEEDSGLRSGSVSSDTGCSSSSDLSDRSSDEGLDPSKELRRKKYGIGHECSNGPEPETDLIEGALTNPPINWAGRPRSFSVQSEISLLAQPWNRVCIGSVARAFEKFGTKVDGETSNNTSSVKSGSQRSRRQSTPGPFK